MKICHLLLSVLVLLPNISFGQNMEEYTGNWQGEIDDPRSFNFKVELRDIQSENATLVISNKAEIIREVFRPTTRGAIVVSINDLLSFEGELSENGKYISGFMKSGVLLYHLKLAKTDTDVFVGRWNALMVDELKSKNLYLSVINGAGNVYQAYPFFADIRFPGTWCANFEKFEDSISFSDNKTGLLFKGHLLPNKIILGIYLANHLITKIELKESQTDRQFGGFDSAPLSEEESYIDLKQMEALIAVDSLPNAHSILISKGGELIYERYFDGYNKDIPHDMRSSSKTISSALVGIAKEHSLFKNVDQSIFDFLPHEYQEQNKNLKSTIDIESLLTMSSGLDAVDFGSQQESIGSEGNYQNTEDWTKTILSASMLYEPNTHANYGSANTHLLGVAMDSMVSQPLEVFMHEELFGKLGMTNYIIQNDEKGKPYFGGGMYMTPSDMLKFGELYLNKGVWNGERILSDNWIERSFKNYRELENTSDRNGYGYLWWHKSYMVNGKTFNSLEARGSGGQYIFVIPDIELVVVMTSGNFRNGRFQQPELILEKYILPKVAQ